LASRTPRTSNYAGSILEPDVSSSRFHNMDLCILLQQENDPTVHEVVKKALRKAIHQRMKKLGMKYDWFDFDHVSLSPHRRDYLEYRFGTVSNICVLPVSFPLTPLDTLLTYRSKVTMAAITSSCPSLLECASPSPSPLHRKPANWIHFTHRPYYIWLGRPRSCDVSRFCHAFEVEGGNMIGNCSPPAALRALKENGVVPPLEIGQSVICLDEEMPAAVTAVDIKPPLSSFHYQVEKVCFRMPQHRFSCSSNG
jgi:betaine lipid synthase